MEWVGRVDSHRKMIFLVSLVCETWEIRLPLIFLVSRVKGKTLKGEYAMRVFVGL